MNLLIVESPGKLKTLRKILGRDWILEASVGHTTELAHDGYKKLGFDIKDGQIVTRYIPRGDRGKQVLSKLRSAIKAADNVYLAMDSDREGEAIAWHLVEQLRLKKFLRVTYTQITESAVKAAIQNPRKLDFPLINAQRARQCLDKLVGYEVSPLLWNSTGGKSAGRVQSATLHLVCERERERQAFKPLDYWTLHSHYTERFSAQFERAKELFKELNEKTNPSEEARTRVLTEKEAKQIEAEARASAHIVEDIESKDDKRLPLPPLITSSLQQTAGVRLRFSSEKTMKIAQELYEGVNGVGLITYMRTDAVTLSPEFVQDCRNWLKENVPSALAERPPVFKARADSQGAHEAIRPTSVELTPEKARSILNSDQFEIYRLIWLRAVASQCKPAKLLRSQITISAGKTRWVSRGLVIVEKGYLEFWHNIEDESEFPMLKKGQKLGLKDIKVEKKVTQPPSRYSEAKLVQLMEKLGIGRPSTYASTIKTLIERSYIEIAKGVISPTNLGFSTDEFLTKTMPDLVDVAFTAQMEQSLDKIAENQIGWEKFLSSWNANYLSTAIVKARSIAQGLNYQPAQNAQNSFDPKRKFKKRFSRRKKASTFEKTSRR